VPRMFFVFPCPGPGRQSSRNSAALSSESTYSYSQTNPLRAIRVRASSITSRLARQKEADFSACSTWLKLERFPPQGSSAPTENVRTGAWTVCDKDISPSLNLVTHTHHGSYPGSFPGGAGSFEKRGEREIRPPLPQSDDDTTTHPPGISRPMTSRHDAEHLGVPQSSSRSTRCCRRATPLGRSLTGGTAHDPPRPPAPHQC